MVRMAIIKMSTNNDVGEGVERGNPLTLSMGLQAGTATVENSVEIP